MLINTTGGYYIVPPSDDGGVATILWSSGGTVSTVDAGSSFSLSAVTIFDYSGGTVFSGIEQGQDRVLPPALVLDSLGSTLVQLAPSGVYSVAIDVSVENSDGSFTTGYTQNGIFQFPDSTTNAEDSDGSIIGSITYPSSETVALVIGDSVVSVKNSAGVAMTTVSVLAEGAEDYVVADSFVSVKDSTGTLLSVVSVLAKGTEDYMVEDSVVSVKDSEGTLISDVSVLAEGTEDYVVGDVAVYVNGGLEDTVPYSGSVYTTYACADVDIEIRNSVPKKGGVLTGVTISSGGNFLYEVADSVVSVENTNGVVIASVNVPAEGAESYVVANSNFSVKDSDGNLIQALSLSPVASAEYLIPDFNIINQDGQTASSVNYSGTVYTNFTGATESEAGIIYQRPVNSQKDSYNDAGVIDNTSASYDEGWHMRNGSYDYTPTGTTMVQLDFTADDPFTALTTTNAFGNNYRFTAADGTQSLPDNYVVDNLTGLGWWSDELYSNDYGGGYWGAQLSAATDSNVGGYSDWRVATWNECQSITNLVGSGYHPTYFSSLVSTYLVLSTTDGSDTNSYITTFIGKHFYKQAKTAGGRKAVYVRNHFN